ncbi:MAG: aspartyl protease family protein [Caulobacterales bacterium]|nr:aspartyl protease family protein [Caulobacterales bacterium]
MSAAFAAAAVLSAASSAGVTREPSAPADSAHVFEIDADRIGRPVIEARVNGGGPFKFIIDTAATRTAVSGELVEELGLPASTPVMVDDLTGVRENATVEIALLEAGELRMERVKAPVISRRALYGADAVLGVDALLDRWLAFDFPDRVEVRTKGRRLRGPGVVRLRATIEESGLVFVRGRVGRVRTHILIDTGGGQTLANTALRESISERRWNRWRVTTTRIIGAYGDWVPGEVAVASSVSVGDIEISNVPLVFGEFHIFSALGLDEEPALILGMDVLRHAGRLIIDYNRGEVTIRP